MEHLGITIRPGQPVHDSVVREVRRAILLGALKPGDSFPSVRGLSEELRINPNTAHRIIRTLVADGVLEVRPGVGTVVMGVGRSSALDRRVLLGDELDRIVVEARRLGLSREQLLSAIERHWRALV